MVAVCGKHVSDEETDVRKKRPIFGAGRAPEKIRFRRDWAEIGTRIRRRRVREQSVKRRVSQGRISGSS